MKKYGNIVVSFINNVITDLFNIGIFMNVIAFTKCKQFT